MPRKTPYTDSIVNFVKQNPGCTKMDVAKHIAINNQIRLGFINAEKQNGKYFLTV